MSVDAHNPTTSLFPGGSPRASPSGRHVGRQVAHPHTSRIQHPPPADPHQAGPPRCHSAPPHHRSTHHRGGPSAAGAAAASAATPAAPPQSDGSGHQPPERRADVLLPRYAMTREPHILLRGRDVRGVITWLAWHRSLSQLCARGTAGCAWYGRGLACAGVCCDVSSCGRRYAPREAAKGVAGE